MILETTWQINLDEIEEGPIKNCLIIIYEWFRTYVETGDSSPSA